MVVLEECMNKLCLVTYTRKNEVYTTHLDRLALELYHIYGDGFKVIIVNDTLRMYKNDDIRMYNFNCITDTIVEVITTCNTYTLLTVHLL